MWYVIQVITGKEEEILRLCKRRVSQELLTDCFCPKYETSFKKAGVRGLETKILFPGYLFLDTERIEEVYEALKNITELTKVLKTGEEFTPITSAEQAFIMKHGNAEHIFAMSVGYMEGDRVLITEGAFAGYKGTLVKVDRHNRYGVMEIDMFGRKTEMRFGLEIVSRV